MFYGRGRVVKLCWLSFRPVARLLKEYSPWAFLAGLRVMAPVACSCIVLSWGSCTCAYWSKLKVAVLVVVDGDTCHYLARAEPPPPQMVKLGER